MQQNRFDFVQLAQQSDLPYATVKGIMSMQSKGMQLKTAMSLVKGLGIIPSEFFDDPSFLASLDK